MRSSARPSVSPERRALSGVDESAPATSSYWSSMREAMRWTAPMNAPSPPPTMPSLILPPFLASLRPSMAILVFSLAQSERALDLVLVDRAAGEIVERLVGNADEVVLDEFGAFARAVLRVLEAAFPFQHRPGRIAVLCHLGEDAGEIDLAVAERTEAPCTLDPGRVARIDPLAPARIEFGVLHMKGRNALMIDVDEVEVIELLQHEMRRVVVDRAALVAAEGVEKALETRSVEEVLARVDLVGDVDARFVERVEDRLPAPGEFLEGRLDQARRALRPRIDIGPGEGAGEGRVRGEAEMLRGFGRVHHLLDRPLLPRLGLAVRFLRSKGVERFVIGGMDGDQLSDHMGRELGDREAVAFRRACDLVAIGLRRRGF